MSHNILRGKCEEINSLDRRINILMEEITMMEKGHEEFEKDLDFDSLLHDQLGDLTIEEIIGTLDLSFPAELIDLDFPPLNLNLQIVESKSQLTVSCLGEMREVSFPEAEGATHAVKIMEKKIGDTQQVVARNRNIRKSCNSKAKKTKTRRVAKVKDKAGEILGSTTSPVKRKANFAPSESLFSSQFISCPHCNAIFSRSNQWMLLQHISDVHSIIINYPCQHCQKQFTCMSSLIAHGMTHVNTNSLECDGCGYKENDVSRFVEHVEIAHGKDSYDEAKKLLLIQKRQM